MSRDVLKATAFTWLMLVGLFGGAFVVAETVDDPSGSAAIVLVASWLAPLVAFAVLASLRPATAQPVFVVATLLVAVFSLADASWEIIPRDDWGPLAAVAVFALGVALGFLGLRRPTPAGLMLVVAALAQLGAVLMRSDGAGPRLVGGSSGVVILPLLVGGVLFLLAGRRGGARSDTRAQGHLSGARTTRS